MYWNIFRVGNGTTAMEANIRVLIVWYDEEPLPICTTIVYSILSENFSKYSNV